MSQAAPLELLKEYENQRSKIISKFYKRIEEITEEFKCLLNNCQQEIDSLKYEYTEKMKQAQKLAEIASKFYETAQRMLQKPKF